MKRLSYILMAFVALVFAGCNPNEFLDRTTLTDMDDASYWTTENNVRLFVNGAYGSYFNGYSDNWGSVYAPACYSYEMSDDRTTTGTQANILISQPSDNWYRAELGYRGYWLQRRGAGPWNFAYIRKWNLLMDRLNTMKEEGKLNDAQYNHWYGVARFFRAWEYCRFVESFGDVPYYDHVVRTEDEDDMYKDRDPRTLVMDACLDDFNFALENVRTDDGTDYVNKYVVGTIASRCMLFEGTWYVYHKTDAAMKTCTDIDGHAKKYLEAAQKFAAYVMDSGKFSFNTPSHELFGHLYTTLTGTAKEVILYRTYNKSIQSSNQHCIASYAGGNGGGEGQSMAGNLSTLKAWICQDGKPYSSSTVENVKSWRLQDMVVTRDARFESTFWDEPRSSATGLYVEKFIDRTGLTYGVDGAPACPACYASCTNENGYPCVRYSETVLNWLEAKAELAEHFGGPAVTQSDIDRSINAIRTRPLDAQAIAKGVKQTAPLQLSWLQGSAGENFDPERTSAPQKACHSYAVTGKFVSPLLWEIRRERRMEFFMEQYRVLDIRRWGQMELMLGANNPDLLVGGWVELDKSQQLTKRKYNLLVKGNVNVVSVKHIAGYNDKGQLELGDRIFFNGTFDDKNVYVSGNKEEMCGFLIPQNIKDRDPLNVDVRNYLEPICTDVFRQYIDKNEATGKNYTLYQNPGWPTM
ncbi:MAG: RagB/SusD family nutrient uptake outer membrane protein, partial [Bacteroidales bacterium]|nr:RagB/SusD family nutrient uptake outer membrane protein [Bacteroidales bacterium]